MDTMGFLFSFAARNNISFEVACAMWELFQQDPEHWETRTLWDLYTIATRPTL